MRNLSMDAMRGFVTVAEMGGFTRAGELLGRSQPAISLQIKRLEEQLDAALFIRKGQRLELTLAGNKLLPLARQILALNDALIAEYRQPDIIGSVRFGVPSEFATHLLPKIVGRFSQSNPGVSLEIKSDLSRNLLSQRSVHYDLVLAVQDLPLRQRVNKVREDELVWVTSRGSEAYLQTPLPLVLAPEPCTYRAKALDKLNEIGRAWRIVYTNTDITGLQAALEEGLGVTVLAKSTVPDSLRILPVSERFPRLGRVCIHLVYDKRTASKAVLKLVDFVAAGLI